MEDKSSDFKEIKAFKYRRGPIKCFSCKNEIARGAIAFRKIDPNGKRFPGIYCSKECAK